MAQREQRVTPLELFFDVVFVYAITQVTLLMSRDPTWQGVGQGLIVLAALWSAWTGYAWLTNTLEPEESLVRAGMFAGMAAMLVGALAVPEAFGAHAVMFGVAYLLVRLLHVLLYAIAGKRDPDVLRAVVRFTPSATLAPLIILAAAFFDGRAQTALWIVALGVDYLGALIGRGRLASVPALALCGGLSIYFFAHVLLRVRLVHHIRHTTTDRPGWIGSGRLATALGTLGLIPAALELSALTALALVAALCWGLIIWDVTRYREHRVEVRQARA